MNKFGVVIFHTTSAAIKAEKILSQQFLKVKLIPTPREFSSDCGVALRFDLEQFERVRSILQKEGVEINSLEVT